MSEPDKNKRVADVKWERPQEYTEGLYAAPIPPGPDAPAPLFWLIVDGEELFFVNSTDAMLKRVSATLGGFETCDDDVVTVNNGDGYTYKDVRPNEAVKIEKFLTIEDSDWMFQITIHIVSNVLGEMKITPPMEKGKVSGQVLLWDNNEPGKNVSIKTGQE
jgi:hypothetical protein